MNKILEYQNLDAELIAIEKQIENSKEIDMLNKMNAMYKEVQSKLFLLEKNAAQLYEEYNKTIKIYEDSLKRTKKLTSSKANEFDKEKLQTDLEEANKISSELFMLERKLNQILVSINNSLNNFKITKNKGITARNNYNKIKDVIKKKKEEVLPKQEKIKAQLAKLQPQLDTSLFAKYKALKHDNVFPAFVPLQVSRCGYCRVQLPSAKINSLKTNDYIVCEQCRRLIYKD